MKTDILQKETEPLLSFLTQISEDPRIGPSHISLYLALWKKWKEGPEEQFVSFFRHDLVALSKISSGNTYHKALRQLQEYGYIRYIPSYNHCLGSLVYFDGTEQIYKTGRVSHI